MQPIFSILLQHHISKLSRYFWSAVRGDRITESVKSVSKLFVYQEYLSYRNVPYQQPGIWVSYICIDLEINTYDV